MNSTPEINSRPAAAGRCLERLVRPIGFPPQVWVALMEIRAAQQRLEDDYPTFNMAGKQFAVKSAAAALRNAHVQIMHYVAEVESRDAEQ